MEKPKKDSAKKPQKRKPRLARIAFVVLVYGCLLALGQWGSEWLLGLVGVDVGKGSAHNQHVMIAGITLFAVLMAIPFVPGVEIGFALLALFGPRAAVAVYIATVTALTLSCLIGRILPAGVIAGLFGGLGLERAKNLILTLRPLSAQQRLALLIEHAPKKFIPVLLKHRYIAIIVALNVPGNAVIGGGGGIAMMAGISGLFTIPRFILTVALAALPVPLVVWLGWV